MNIKNLIAVAASAMVFTRSFADTNITENVTLTADTDWRADGVVTVPAGVTVDLNGHMLWVSGLAGAGTFTSAVADPATFDLTTAQTDATRVKSYQGGTDQSLGTEFTFTIQPAWKLFADYASYNKTTQRTITAFTNETSNPIDIVYEFDAPTAVNSYKIQVTSADSYLERSPRTWKFFGSVTGENDTWVELDSQTDVTDWTIYEQRQFTFFNDTAYKFYRLRIIQAHGGGDLGDYLEFFKLEYGRMQNQVRIVPSQAGGFASASNTVSGTAKFVVAGGALAANADLRGLGKVSVASGETLDLARHYLRVHAIDGTARVTTSVTSTFLDLTSASEAATRASAATNGVVKVLVADNKYPVAQAFDNDNDTFTYDNTSKLEINYDFGESTIIDGYRILFNKSDGSYPKAWTFDGSDDGASWTVLDAQTGQSFTLGSWKTYALGNAGAYRYYRLNVTATSKNNALHISELEFGRVLRNSIYVDADGIAASDFSAIVFSGGASFALPEGDTLVLSGNLDLSGFKVDGTIDLNGHELWLNGLDGTGTITDSSTFDLTDSEPGRVSSPNTFLSSGPAAAAFGDYKSYINPGHRTIANLADNLDKMPIQIDYTFPVATVVDAYRVMYGDNGDYVKYRAPKSIKFYGSNDGIEWAELDARSHETGWVENEERQFEFTNETAYAKYRIEFHANNGIDSNGGDYIEFFKLEYGNTGRFGRLHVAVPSGTKTNSGVALTGNLRLIKEGAGTLVASKTGQTYGGGTEIVGGTLKPGTGGSNHPFGAAGRDIVVRESAVLDAAGQVGFGKYEITLDGGNLTNTGADATELAKTQFRRVRLTKDSSLTSTRSMFFGVSDAEASTVYLGGHTLTVSITSGKELRFYSMAILDGTFDITSGGYFVVGGSGGIVATNNVDFLAACGLVVTMPVQVDNYTAKWISTRGKDTSTKPIKVYGRFTPATTHFHGVEMQDGSTIDLSGWSGGWPLASDLNAGVKDVLFASGATVKIDISGRTDLKALAKSASPYLLTWSTAPSNVTFAMADGSTYVDGVRLRQDATGLKVETMRGLTITVK